MQTCPKYLMGNTRSLEVTTVCLKPDTVHILEMTVMKNIDDLATGGKSYICLYEYMLYTNHFANADIYVFEFNSGHFHCAYVG